MGCRPTDTLYETLTTTTTGALATVTTESVSTATISGTFLSSLCASTVAGACVLSTPQTLSFTYTTLATNQVILTTRPILTTTQAVPTRTLEGNCYTSVFETTLPNGSVSVSSIFVTVSTGGNSPNTSAGTATGDSSTQNTGAIVGGAVGGVTALAILIGVIWVLWRRNNKLKKQIKANEEEEKRNGIINVEELLPSPYVQYPPPFSPSQGHPGYPPSNPDAYRQSAATPTSISNYMALGPHSYGEQAPEDGLAPGVIAAGVVGRVATTQYTPTHSRDGSFSTQAPAAGRPSSTAPSGHDHPPVSPLHPTEASSSGTTPGASAKAREAFQHRRRSALYAQNAAEGEGEDDFVMPANATAVRSTVPPSAWGAPPAYTPDD